MDRRKFLSTIGVGAAAAGLAACASDSDDDTDAQGESGGGEGGLITIIVNDPSNPYWKTEDDLAAAKAEELGYSATVGAHKGDTNEENSLVDTAISNQSEEHTSELQSRFDLVCRLLLEKKKKTNQPQHE